MGPFGSLGSADALGACVDDHLHTFDTGLTGFSRSLNAVHSDVQWRDLSGLGGDALLISDRRDTFDEIMRYDLACPVTEEDSFVITSRFYHWQNGNKPDQRSWPLTLIGGGVDDMDGDPHVLGFQHRSDAGGYIGKVRAYFRAADGALHTSSWAAVPTGYDPTLRFEHYAERSELRFRIQDKDHVTTWSWTYVLPAGEAFAFKRVAMASHAQSDVLSSEPFSRLVVDDIRTAVNTATWPVAIIIGDLDVVDADLSGYETVHLDGSGSYDPDGAIVSREWLYEGTVVGTGTSIGLTLAPGTHQIAHRVVDDEDMMDLETVTVRVRSPPVAVIDAPAVLHDADGDGVESLTLDGSGSYDADNEILEWEWFRDEAFDGSGRTIDRTAAIGTHAWRLDVTDEDLLTGSATHTVVVYANTAPIADAGADVLVVDHDDDGQAIAPLDASASSDPNGGIVSYAWHLGADLIATGAQAATSMAVGTHTVTLTVTDEGGLQDLDTVQVVVEPNELPVAVLDAPVTVVTDLDEDTDPGELLSFDGHASYDPDGTVILREWYLGGTLVGSGHDVDILVPGGVHEVTLVVTDDDGGQASASVTVNVNRVPDAVITVRDCRDGLCRFDASLSGDDDGDALSYRWDFGTEATDVATSMPQAEHAFADMATKRVCLRADDGLATSPGHCAWVTPMLYEDFDDHPMHQDHALKIGWPDYDGTIYHLGQFRVDLRCSPVAPGSHYLGWHGDAPSCVSTTRTYRDQQGAIHVPVDLTDQDGAVLSFDMAYNFDDALYGAPDKLTLEVWEDSDLVAYVYTYGGGIPTAVHSGRASMDWSRCGFSLSDFAGRAIELRWHVHIDDEGNQWTGPRVDNVRVVPSSGGGGGPDLDPCDEPPQPPVTVYVDS